MKNKVQIGTKLLKLRQENGLKQLVIAELLNISQSTISNIEKNQLSPNYHQIQTLATFFKVPVSFFFDDEFITVNQENNEECLQKIQTILTDFKQTVSDFRNQIKDKDTIINHQQNMLNMKNESMINLELMVKKHENTITKLIWERESLKSKLFFDLGSFNEKKN